MYHASKRLKSQESWQFRKSCHATFPAVTLYWDSKGWIPKSPMQLSIEERNCWETSCVSRLVEQYVLARRDKRFLYPFSEGLTREASQRLGMRGTFCNPVKHLRLCILEFRKFYTILQRTKRNTERTGCSSFCAEINLTIFVDSRKWEERVILT